MAKTAPIHLAVSASDLSPLCRAAGKSFQTVTEPGAATCKRCLAKMQAQSKLNPAAHAEAKALTEQAVAENRAAAGLPPVTAVPELPPKKLPIFDLTDAADKARYEAEGYAERETSKVVSISEALNKPKKTMSAEIKAKLSAKKERKPVKTFLLDPVIKFRENGSVESITGTCPECKTNKRTIHAADAFQVKRCVECQKKAVTNRVNKSRTQNGEKAPKAKPAKAPKAKVDAAFAQVNANTEREKTERERAVEIMRKGGDLSDVADDLGISTSHAREIVLAVNAEAAQAK